MNLKFNNAKTHIRWVLICAISFLGVVNLSIGQTMSPPNSPPISTNSSDTSLSPYKGPTIDKIKRANEIVIGIRSSSIPISFLDQNKKPLGYGLDTCLEIVEKIKQVYNLPNMNVVFKEVTSANRIPLVVNGTVDLECGSTTNNASRRKDVDFSIPYYISGVRILVKNSSGITKLNDLRGKRIVLGIGTTSIPLIEKINKERAMNMNLIIAPTFPDAINAVDKNKADAFVLDDLLLFGERSKMPNANEFSVVGEFLSVEPLAIMFRKNDPAFKIFINQQMNLLMLNGKMDILYKKWFESPIPPTNKNLNIPQSPLLKDIFRMPTEVVGT